MPYRLEMQARLAVKGEKDLYGFWKGKISEKLLEDGAEPVLNLASKEYSRAVEPYLPPHVPFITCIFGEYSEGKVKMKGTQAKMARGEMVRWIAENQIQDWKDITEFDGLGYHFDGELSGGTELVFCRS